MNRTIPRFNHSILRRVTVIATTLALALGVSQARASTVSETVTISSSPDLTINSSFVGLSYEKKWMAVNGYFSSTNTAVINLFKMLGSGVVRIGGGTVDLYNWNGYDNCKPITSAEVDSLAAFMTNVPKWKVIYGINFASNSEANATAEASYVHNALGSQLLGFEIGNEPDEYYLNGLRGSSFTYNDYINQWNPLKLGTESYGALVGPATASFTAGHREWTTNFAYDEAGIISMATQHYYRGNAELYSYGSSTAMQLLITNDPALPGNISRDVSDINSDGSKVASGGLRMDECGSMVNGGLWGVSDAFGSAEWALDYMFILALNGAQGVNFHGGGKSAYCPIFDNNNYVVTRIGPEFYALKMFSLVPPGKVRSTTISPARPYYTAYAVSCTSGGFSVLLNNKDTAKTMATTVNLGSDVSSAILYELTGTSWYQTNGYTLGGATITTNGTWNGGGQSIIQTSNGQLTVNVPPYNAFLLNPVTVGSKPVAVTSGTSGPNFNLRGTLTSGPADFVCQYGGSSDTNYVMGDWDGNGTMTPGVVRDTGGQWEWLLSNSRNGGSATYDFFFGNALPGDILVVGDWDGNGTWTPGIVRTNSTGNLEWLLTDSDLTSGTAPTNYDFAYGDAGDIPFVGDWDGNGTFTPGVVKAGSNTWSLRNENSSGVADLTFGYGSVGDTPIVGDWDGNGTWTCGVIKAGSNTWDLRNSNSSGGAQISFGYGGAGNKFLVWQ